MAPGGWTSGFLPRALAVVIPTLVVAAILVPTRSLLALPVITVAFVISSLVALVAPSPRSGLVLAQRTVALIIPLLALCVLFLSMTDADDVLINGEMPQLHVHAPKIPAFLGPRTLPKLENLSVVLPCAFEGEFAAKTVRSIWENTVHSSLHEIIVVDDGSQPPLMNSFPPELLATSGPGAPPTRILRHETTKGLIGAKLAGGNSATGDVIVFFDCHIRPRPGWESGVLKQMQRAGDHRTIVVPGIGSLDVDTWQEINPNFASYAMFLLWNADFTWLTPELMKHDMIPIASGGILAISKQWWTDIGGYDEGMIAWGGENIDQSLRTWLCGGRIEAAKGTFIAHMWRDASKPKTRLRYPIPAQAVMRNKARAVNAWMGDYTNKVMGFPEYENFHTGVWNIGNMSSFDAVKERLGCKPFGFYLETFSHIYIDGGLVPEQIFQLREKTTGLCMHRLNTANQVARSTTSVVLRSCAVSRHESAELQLWHFANGDKRRGGRCCSGIMNWNYLQCLSVGATVTAADCNLAGSIPNQRVELTKQGQLKTSDKCIAPGTRVVASQKTSPASSSRVVVEDASCTDCVSGTHFVLKTKLSGEADACAQADDGKLSFSSCGDGELQVFTRIPVDEGHVIAVGFHQRETLDSLSVSGQNCLDAASGTNVLVYPCYSQEKHNANQVWVAPTDGHLCWSQRGDHCLDAQPLEAQQSQGTFVLETCSDKRGQRFRKAEPSQDAIGGGFLLKDDDTGKCLGVAHQHLTMVDCTDEDRWLEEPEGRSVMHMVLGWCLTEAGSNTVSVHPCGHRGGNSEFEVASDVGLGVRVHGRWSDNGRQRWWERCVDYAPGEEVKLHTVRCQEATSRSVSWERISVEVPEERRIWNAYKNGEDTNYMHV